MSQLFILAAGSASSYVSAFNACLQTGTHSWDIEGLDSLTRAQVRQLLVNGKWDALFLDGQFADLTRSAVKVQAASMQVAGGADLVFIRKDTSVAVNLFGSATVAHMEYLGYAFGGSHVVVCGSGTRALSLVQALAVAGADHIVLLDETPRKSEEAMRLYLSRYKRLARATVDLAPAENMHRSFAEAYEQPVYQFGSFTTSTQVAAKADYLFAVGEHPFDRESGVPESVFGDQIAVYHAGAAPAESTFSTAAQVVGCNVVDGRGTLAYAIAQAAAVLSQLHYDYVDLAPEGVPDATEDALLPQSIESMFVQASAAFGM